MTKLYRKRLIPDECIYLKDDRIICKDDHSIITTWQTLHPKDNFDHGISWYLMDNGWKISIFYRPDNSVCCIYCDIIHTNYNKETDEYIFTDLLADVIIENDGSLKVVDLDELADACCDGLISNELLTRSLHQLNSLLNKIYDKSFYEYIKILKEYSL